ncbi:MAG: hypothetical protein IJB42_04360 [Oscillospiraceae bacterium]|nr:hypothetical protein [Oscillospiraceae bacterium]MBQ3224922.1 hypothetical protein [Oscillospiraceae bacterium]MBR2181328.1 hypothetical protein [Oscillospiraceae bacterium]
MSYVLPAVFLAALFFDFRAREGKEKRAYIVLGVISLLLAVFSGIAAESDHVGASLSGMISIFMR